ADGAHRPFPQSARRRHARRMVRRRRPQLDRVRQRTARRRRRGPDHARGRRRARDLAAAQRQRPLDHRRPRRPLAAGARAAADRGGGGRSGRRGHLLRLRRHQRRALAQRQRWRRIQYGAGPDRRDRRLVPRRAAAASGSQRRAVDRGVVARPAALVAAGPAAAGGRGERAFGEPRPAGERGRSPGAVRCRAGAGAARPAPFRRRRTALAAHRSRWNAFWRHHPACDRRSPPARSRLLRYRRPGHLVWRSAMRQSSASGSSSRAAGPSIPAAARPRLPRLQAMAAAALVVLAAGAQAVELPRVFGDGMVLQRDQPILVWGSADPGAHVEVALAGDRARATADADGRWRVELPARAAGGGPLLLRIDDGKAPRELRDVVMGDVWLASGQSNMEWPISQSADAQAEIARATDPLIRHFKVPRSWSGLPQRQLSGGEWVASSPEAAGTFSAVAHFFARELRDSQDVPIGIIDSTWGGSSIEAWMDADAQGIDGDGLAEAARQLEVEDRQALAQARANLARWTLPADDAGWQARELDTSGWDDLPVPGVWESAGWNGMDGVAWYRTSFELSPAGAQAGVTLGVGRIDDSDTTWVNGVEVGRTHMQYNLARAYAVPASALRAGSNTVAVRVTDTGGGGGIH